MCNHKLCEICTEIFIAVYFAYTTIFHFYYHMLLSLRDCLTGKINIYYFQYKNHEEYKAKIAITFCSKC